MPASPHSSKCLDAYYAQENQATPFVSLAPTQDHCGSPMQEPEKAPIASVRMP